MALKPFLDFLYLEKANIQRQVDMPMRGFRKDIKYVVIVLSSDNH